jgi:hypothetical protein
MPDWHIAWFVLILAQPLRIRSAAESYRQEPGDKLLVVPAPATAIEL